MYNNNTIVRVYELEVFNTGLVYSAVEIENKSLGFFVPLRRFVDEIFDIGFFSSFELLEHAISVLLNEYNKNVNIYIL